jgi:hypothetical protein
MDLSYSKNRLEKMGILSFALLVCEDNSRRLLKDTNALIADFLASRTMKNKFLFIFNCLVCEIYSTK